jgi:hypothetical protein
MWMETPQNCLLSVVVQQMRKESSIQILQDGTYLLCRRTALFIHTSCSLPSSVRSHDWQTLAGDALSSCPAAQPRWLGRVAKVRMCAYQHCCRQSRRRVLTIGYQEWGRCAAGILLRYTCMRTGRHRCHDISLFRHDLPPHEKPYELLDRRRVQMSMSPESFAAPELLPRSGSSSPLLLHAYFPTVTTVLSNARRFKIACFVATKMQSNRIVRGGGGTPHEMGRLERHSRVHQHSLGLGVSNTVLAW